MSLFGEPDLEPVAVDPLDAIIARRQAAERERNARRRGTRVSHPCPACGRRTFRRPRRYPSRGVVDDRCTGCAEGNPLTGLGPVDATQHVDRAGLNSGLDDRPRCTVHITQLAPCGICALLLELDE